MSRAWLPTSSGPSSGTFKVVTYNVLADKYSDIFRNNAASDAEFKRTLEWKYREANQISELRGYAPDILFCQEVEQPYFYELQKALNLEGIYLPRACDVRGRADMRPEGIALFYSSEFELIEHKSTYFQQVPLHPLGIPPSSRLNLDYTTKGEGWISAVLRHKATGRSLLAAATHIFWNPSLPHVKLLQAWALSAGLAADCRRPDGARLPVILGGDFNSLPVKLRPDAFDPELPAGGALVSALYELLVHGKAIDVRHGDHPAVRGCPECASVVVTPSLEPLKSAAATFLGHEPPLTTRTIAQFSGTLDYVLYTSRGLSLRGFLALPYKVPKEAGREVDPEAVPESELKQLPNAEFSSDHLAIGAQLAFYP